MYRILVVEDDEDIRKILENYLRENGYEVELAADGVEGISKFHGGRFDLVILDIMMPKIDGFGVCELIRKESDVPVIMLTALEEEEYQIRGLDLQADDYITKPFSVPVLMRKIAALMRRVHRNTAENRQITYRRLQLDLEGYHVYRTAEDGKNKTEIILTQKEFELLYVLLLNKGIVLTRQKLLNLVWGEDYFGEERIVDTHIKNIRKKLECNYISTIRGVGYRIDRENKK